MSDQRHKVQWHPHQASPENSRYATATMHDASHLSAAPQGIDHGDSAMQLNTAPVSCSEYATLQKPLVPNIQAANDQDPVESHKTIGPDRASHEISRCTASTKHDADEDGNIQAADAAHLVASHLNAAPQGHDSGAKANAMQFNAAPISCTENSTLPKPLMAKVLATKAAHINAYQHDADHKAWDANFATKFLKSSHSVDS